MKRTVVVIVAAVCLWIQSGAGAAELSLFNVTLSDATPASLHQAALAAGARLIKSSGGRRVYDASRIGLPGARTLETLFDGERFVIAAYTFKRTTSTDYELRRLLIAKYGQAKIVTREGKTYEVDISGRYHDGGIYQWSVDPPMELIYADLLESLGPPSHDYQTRLTYVNRTLFEELKQREAEIMKKADRDRAGRMKGAF
jgi:hypothetical protein